MSNHLNEFHTIFSQLTLQEILFPNILKAMFLLITLSDSWDTFCMALSNYVTPDGLTSANVKGSLLAEEVNQKNTEKDKGRNAPHQRQSSRVDLRWHLGDVPRWRTIGGRVHNPFCRRQRYGNLARPRTILLVECGGIESRLRTSRGQKEKDHAKHCDRFPAPVQSRSGVSVSLRWWRMS